jgi:hypothetical protein
VSDVYDLLYLNKTFQAADNDYLSYVLQADIPVLKEALTQKKERVQQQCSDNRVQQIQSDMGQVMR